MNLQEFKKRAIDFYKNNPDKQQYISGIDEKTCKVAIKTKLPNGQDKIEEVSIEELENGTFDWNKVMAPVATPVVENIPTVEAVNPEPVQSVPTVEEIPQVQPVAPVAPAPVVEPINTNVSLNDVKTLFETSTTDLNSKNTLDAVIKSFASTPDGNVDINKAISVVTENSMNAVVLAAKENKCLPNELYKYDKQGIIIANDNNMPYTGVNPEIEKAFNNVLVYANGASLYGITYTSEVIDQAKQAFISNVNAKLAQGGVSQAPETPITPDNVAPAAPVQEQSKTLNLALENNEEKAGFADIFILVMIVAVYAVIIANLILKIK